MYTLGSLLAYAPSLADRMAAIDCASIELMHRAVLEDVKELPVRFDSLAACAIVEAGDVYRTKYQYRNTTCYLRMVTNLNGVYGERFVRDWDRSGIDTGLEHLHYFTFSAHGYDVSTLIENVKRTMGTNAVNTIMEARAQMADKEAQRVENAGPKTDRVDRLGIVDEYYPNFSDHTSMDWSDWTIRNVYDFITDADQKNIDLDAFISGVEKHLGSDTAKKLVSARREYLDFMKRKSDETEFVKNLDAEYAVLVEPILEKLKLEDRVVNYLWRNRVEVIKTIKETMPMVDERWASAHVDARQVMQRAREIHHGHHRPDVDELLSLLPARVDEAMIRLYAAGRDVSHPCRYIEGQIDGFAPMAPVLDNLIRSAAMARREPQITKSAILPASLTADEEELLSLLEQVDPSTHSSVLNQVQGFDIRTINRYIKGEQELTVDNLGVLGYELRSLVNIARTFRAKPVEQPIIGAKTMQVEHHARTQCTSDEFTGTITLVVDGQLAIVDLLAKADSDVLHKHWITVPAKGYDFTVHHTIVWKNGKCAVAVIILVYKDGGEVKSVTISHDI